MNIDSEQKALSYLSRIGYYRLSAYWYQFRKSERCESDATAPIVILDEFQDNIYFSHAVKLYVFDKKLRLLMLDAIERIEVSMRVEIAYLLGATDPWAHLKPQMLDGRFVNKARADTQKTVYEEWLDKLRASKSRSKEDFIRHFSRKYDSPPPIWVSVEIWDFGILSRFYSGMRYNDKKVISDKFGVPSPAIIEGWLRSINYVRNICAHHARLWNKNIIDQPKIPRIGDVPLLDHINGNTQCQSRVYGVASIIQYLMRYINPSSSWPERLKSHINTFPEAPSISPYLMGFPEGWGTLLLWQMPAK